MNASSKFAVILFNIGGPDNIEDSSIKKYLMNFFSDKFIIRKNFILRKFIAFIISSSRYRKTQDIYKKIGGKSPILENTKSQAKALKTKLGEKFDIFVSMRYWSPFSSEIIKSIELNKYDQIILLPLYPQCSSTTTVSAFEDWKNNIKKFFDKNTSKTLLSKTKLICNHFENEKYIESVTNLILDKYFEAKTQIPDGKFKLFFSAHSIPKFLVIEKNDPYQNQIIKTVEKIMTKLQSLDCNIDHIITYQSKVGKLEWLEPMTDSELIKTAKENIIPIIIPIAFVSENSETLFELDIDYKELLEENGMHYMFRIPTVSCNELYIECLRDLILNTISNPSQFPTTRYCDNKNTDCPCIKYENIS